MKIIQEIQLFGAAVLCETGGFEEIEIHLPKNVYDRLLFEISSLACLKNHEDIFPNPEQSIKLNTPGGPIVLYQIYKDNYR